MFKKINKLKDRLQKLHKLKAKRKRIKKKWNIQHPGHNLKRCCTYSENIRRKKQGRKFKVVIAKNFPKLKMDTKPQIQEVQKTSSKENTKKYIQQFISQSIYTKSKTKRNFGQKPDWGRGDTLPMGK